MGCVCVCERESERECVYVCVRERERERVYVCERETYCVQMQSFWLIYGLKRSCN